VRVLVVANVQEMAESIAQGLRTGSRYAVDIARSYTEAIEFVLTAEYDLIVLDLMSPGSGEDALLFRIRAMMNATPLLILIAVTETLRTIVMLDAGADDFLIKPFTNTELEIRCHALIRRGKSVNQRVLGFADLELHPGERSVKRQGRNIHLSATEFSILEYMMHRPRFVISKRELMEHVYDFSREHRSNVIEVHVSNLRKKLRISTDPDLIHTMRGGGYKLVQI
jgi:two-component system response regulator PhoP